MVKVGRYKGTSLDPQNHTKNSSTLQSDLDHYVMKKLQNHPGVSSPIPKGPPQRLLHTQNEGDREEETPSDASVDLPVSRSFISQALTKALNPVLEELSEIKCEMRQIGQRVEILESTQTALTVYTKQTTSTLATYQQHINYLYEYIEDQDNRGRRNNIRLRGVPESVAPEATTKAVSEICQRLLGADNPDPIIIERAHRALRPKPKPNDPPRDIICKLLNYAQKEQVMRKARECKTIEYEGSPVLLFQDLAPATLNKRRILKPLSDYLRHKHITFRWLFPFGMLITWRDRKYAIRSPKDIPEVLTALGIEDVDIPDWSATSDVSIPPEITTATTWETTLSAKAHRNKKRQGRVNPGQTVIGED